MLKKESKNKKKNNNTKKKDTIVWLFFVVAVVFFSLIFVSFFVRQSTDESIVQNDISKKYATGPQVPFGDPLITSAKTLYPKVLADDVRKGNTDANVTVFFYCDLLSPLCKSEQDEINKLWSVYSEEELRVVWKGTAATPEGILVQKAAYCANLQDKFWEYQEIVFNEQDIVDIKRLEEIASELSLIQSEFNACVQEVQMEDKVYENNIEASDLGIDALPYFFIDNTPYRGFFIYQELGEIIDYLIK